MVRYPCGTSSATRARKSSVRRMRHGAPGDLFTSDDAVVEPTMNGGRRNAECIGNLCDIHQFSIWWVGWPLITSDVPLSAQTTDKIRSEAMTIRGSALLSVENTGYDGVRVMSC